MAVRGPVWHGSRATCLPDVSIIVPVLNEAPLIRPFLRHQRARAPGAEIILADGGSSDGTVDLASGFYDQLVHSERSRAMQMNAGARVARGDVLWFVHADAELPRGCLDEIAQILHQATVVGGYFRIRLPQGPVYRLTDGFAHYAGILLRMRCGDHGLFCRSTVFQDIGGFPEVPLMEDVEFFRRLRSCGRVVHSDKRILVSPRRYEAIGRVRLTFAYGFIATLYVFGVPLPKLASIYKRACGDAPVADPNRMATRRDRRPENQCMTNKTDSVHSISLSLNDMGVLNQLMHGAATGFLTLTQMVALAESPNPTMKAIVVHEYGGPEVLKYEDAPKPEPKEDQILVRVMAAGVNPVDEASRSQKYAKFFGITLPFIPGYDIAGVVEKIGAKITRFRTGDPVYAYLSLKDGGGYAEYAVATEVEAAPKPQSITFGEAAGVPVVALTAWQALIDTAKLSAGQTVLIHGGSGGVGTFAVQIAKARGAKVIATASTANQDLLKQLGADVAIDYTKQKFEDVAKDVDVVLDSVGKDTLARSYGVVKKGGFIVTLVARIDQGELDKHSIRGASLGVEPNSSQLTEIGKLIDEKKIKVVVSQTFPLSEAMKAQQQVATGHTRGKIVLRVAEEPK